MHRRELTAALTLLLSGASSGVSAQAVDLPSLPGGPGRCADGEVVRIEIRNNSLFAPEDLEGRSFAWALGLANWLHLRTREGYLRDELLLREGDCYDPELLDESVRLLREAPFIARVEADPARAGPDQWTVRIETWDEWTTQVSINYSLEGEFRFKGVSLAEKNFLGRGLNATLGYHRFREYEIRNVALGNPRLFGTRANAWVSAARTRTGSYFRHDLSYPFVGEVGRIGVRATIEYNDRQIAYVTDGTGTISNVLLPLEDRIATVSFDRRFGAPGSLTLVGGEVEILRREVNDEIRQVTGGDFEGAPPAADTLVAALGRQASPPSYFKAAVHLGIRRLRFVPRQGLDLMSGVQDVAVGTELTLAVGRTLGTWGTAARDTYGWVDAFAGAAFGPVVGNAGVLVRFRRLDEAPADGSPWRDMLVAGRATVYVRSGDTPANTVVGGTRFNIRWNPDQPYQTVLGGAEGVRSHTDVELPSGSTLVAYLEDHVDVGWLRPAVDLGFTVFGDVGRGWAAGSPFAQDTGWRKAVGVGIRAGFPAGTGNVARAELAWPVGEPDGGDGPLYRVYWSSSTTSR